MKIDSDDGDDLVDLQGRVGDAGETYFQLMANAGGGVANKSLRDRLGWDFHFQLPRDGGWRAHHSLDTRPPEPSCFVQVKATTRPIRSWAIKLSTWERLAKERRSVFFVVLMFDAESLERPLRGYIIHLGEDLLARVLKALREVSAEAADDLNHRSMSFAWDEADALPELTGSELIAAIRRHVGPDVGAYEANKAKLVKTLGYNGGRHNISLRVLGEVTNDEMVAFALGLRDSLSVEIERVVEERFGIAKSALDGPHVGEAEIHLPNLTPDANGFVVLEGSTGEKVRISCKIYTARWLAPILPSQRRGIRVVVDGGEFAHMSRGGGAETRLTYALPDVGERMPLAQAVRRAKVARILADPRGCHVRLDIEGVVAASPPLDLSGADAGDSVLYAEVIFCAGRLASAADLDPNIEVEPIKLLDQARQVLAAATRHMMTVNGGPVESVGNAALESLGDAASPGVVLLPNEVTLGPYCISSVIGITGIVRVDPTNGRFEVTGVPEILKVDVSDVGAPVSERLDHWVAAIAEVRRRGFVHLLVPRGVLDDARPDETEKT